MDLETTYLGIRLKNPLVASASPLSHTLDGVRRLAEGGVAAVVLHSLFEEELEHEAERDARLAEAGSESFAESLSYFPEVPGADAGPHRYLSVLERAAAALDVPVIASLNGSTPAGWTSYARQMQDSGAAAIELNLYASPPDLDTPGREVEARHIEILGLVKDAVEVPVAVKMSAHYSSVGEMARRFVDAGASGLVIFNRFLHPDVDPDALAVVPGIGLSAPSDARLPRTWIALLRRRLEVSLAASTGVEDPRDVVAYLLAGADVVMSTSALLRHGPEHAHFLVDGLSAWMSQRGFDRLGEFRGLLAVPADVDRSSSERSDYVRAMRAANASAIGPW